MQPLRALSPLLPTALIPLFQLGGFPQDAKYLLYEERLIVADVARLHGGLRGLKLERDVLNVKLAC